MKYSSANIFDDFEFHDAWFALKHAGDRELTLSAEHVNIHASAEENPHGRDMELGTAAITLHGFRITSYATGGQWTRNEKNELVATAPQTILMGEAGERRLLDALRSGVTVYEFGVHEEGGCYLEGGGTDPWFHARLTFDAARIRWDGWKGAAWYADMKHF